MFTKKLTTAGILTLFSALLHAISVGNDTAYILNKVLNSPSRQNSIISFNEHGAYFTRYSYYSYSNRASATGPFYRISTNIPVKFSIFGGVHGMVDGIALPGDTTIIEIDYKNLNIPVKFSGKTAEICDFYSASNKILSNFYHRDFTQNTINTYFDYFDFLEVQYQRRDSFFNAYIQNNKLPEWFQTFYKSELIYTKALSMIENIHTINYSSRTKIYPNPEFLLWFRDIAIDNPQAMKNQVYFDFLWQYFLWKSKIIWNRTMGGRVSTEWLALTLPHINNELKGSVKEWFLKELMVNYYAAMDVDDVDSAYSVVKPYLTNNQYLEEINQFRDKALEFREKRFASAAKVGSKAPRFHLVDSMNRSYPSDKFYGKWTYLKFFNSKTLTEESFNTRFLSDSVFIDKVQFVNIYTNSDKNLSKKNLSQCPGSVLHLFCKGNWGEMLKYQYGLRFYPYAVLVDPQGIIQYSGKLNDDELFALVK